MKHCDLRTGAALLMLVAQLISCDAPRSSTTAEANTHSATATQTANTTAPATNKSAKTAQTTAAPPKPDGPVNAEEFGFLFNCANRLHVIGKETQAKGMATMRKGKKIAEDVGKEELNWGDKRLDKELKRSGEVTDRGYKTSMSGIRQIDCAVEVMCVLDKLQVEGKTRALMSAKECKFYPGKCSNRRLYKHMKASLPAEYFATFQKTWRKVRPDPPAATPKPTSKPTSKGEPKTAREPKR